MTSSKHPPRFWSCTVSGCLKASAVDTGACERCCRHYCWEHIDSALHQCEKSPLDDEAWISARNRELQSVREKVVDQALLRKAYHLNGGVDCWIQKSDITDGVMLGGMHMHLEICFADGSAWLARIPRENFTSFSDDITDSIIVSECATLKWLESTGLPVPRLYGFGLLNDPMNDVGVPYMLIDKLKGTPFIQLSPSGEEKQKVYSALTNVFGALWDRPLDKIGSFTFSNNGQVEIGAIVGDRTGTLTQCGPFDDAKAYYAACFEQYLKLISDHQLFATYAVDAYIMFAFMKEQVLKGGWTCFEPKLDSSPFFLKHMDDKGDHILVDEEFNITGFIDWSFARIVPAYEAFGPSLLTANLDALFTGEPGRSTDDEMLASSIASIYPPLVRFFQSRDIVRRLTLALGVGMGFCRDETIALFKCILTTLNIDIVDFDAWRKDYEQCHTDDGRLQILLNENISQIMSRW